MENLFQKHKKKPTYVTGLTGTEQYESKKTTSLQVYSRWAYKWGKAYIQVQELISRIIYSLANGWAYIQGGLKTRGAGIVQIHRCCCLGLSRYTGVVVWDCPYTPMLSGIVQIHRCCCLGLSRYTDVAVLDCLDTQMLLSGIVQIHRCCCLGLSRYTGVVVWDCPDTQMLLSGIVHIHRYCCLGLSRYTDVVVWDCPDAQISRVV